MPLDGQLLRNGPPFAVPVSSAEVTDDARLGFSAWNAATAVSTVLASALQADDTAARHATKGEDNHGRKDAEDHDDDEKFNQGEPVFSLAGGLLALDFVIPMYHFFSLSLGACRDWVPALAFR